MSHHEVDAVLNRPRQYDRHHINAEHLCGFLDPLPLLVVISDQHIKQDKRNIGSIISARLNLRAVAFPEKKNLFLAPGLFEQLFRFSGPKHGTQLFQEKVWDLGSVCTAAKLDLMTIPMDADICAINLFGEQPNVIPQIFHNGIAPTVQNQPLRAGRIPIENGIDFLVGSDIPF